MYGLKPYKSTVLEPYKSTLNRTIILNCTVMSTSKPYNNIELYGTIWYTLIR